MSAVPGDGPGEARPHTQDFTESCIALIVETVFVSTADFVVGVGEGPGEESTADAGVALRVEAKSAARKKPLM